MQIEITVPWLGRSLEHQEKEILTWERSLERPGQKDWLPFSKLGDSLAMLCACGLPFRIGGWQWKYGNPIIKVFRRRPLDQDRPPKYKYLYRV